MIKFRIPEQIHQRQVALMDSLANINKLEVLRIADQRDVGDKRRRCWAKEDVPSRVKRVKLFSQVKPRFGVILQFVCEM